MQPPGDKLDMRRMFDLYVHDYMIRKDMHTAANVFKNEAQVSDEDILLTSTNGFMSDWWAIFSDVYASRFAEQKEADENLNAQVIPMGPPQDRGKSHMYNSSFDMMMANPTTCLAAARSFEEECMRAIECDPNIPVLLNMPGSSSSHLQQMISNGRPPMVPRENREGSVWGRNALTDPAPFKGLNQFLLPRRDGEARTRGINYLQLAESALGVANQLPGGNMRDQGLDSFLQVPRQQIQTQQGSFISSEPGQSVQSFPQVPQQGSFFSSELGQSMQSLFPQVPQQQIQIQQGPFLSSELGRSVQSYPEMSTDLIGSSRFVRTNNEMDPRITALFKKPTKNGQPGETQLQLKEMGKNEKKRKSSSNTTSGDRISAGNVNAEENVSIDENIDAFLSQEEEEDKAEDSSGWRSSGRRKDTGFSFEQIGRLHSSKSKVTCCHFSSGGTLLASAGHDKKVYICNVGSFDVKCSSEEHTQLISDVRFRPKSTFLATASFDKSIIMWNAHRPSKPLFRLLGHNEQVTSLDFNPRKTSFLSSCDSSGEIRLWNINSPNKFVRAAQGANRVVRFQPQTGDFLAGALGNVINLIDIETGEIQLELKGHTNDVRSICWDISGKYIASASEDSARIWSVGSGKCIHRLYSDGNNFQSCTFHPAYMLMVVIGGYQNLHLWNPAESSKTMTVEAHDGFVASLSESSQNELIASASHDQWVKLWK